MKKSICQGFFPREMPLVEAAKRAADAGFDGLQVRFGGETGELCLTTPDDELEKIKKISQELGIAFHSFIPGVPHRLGDEKAEDRKEAVRMYARAVEVAAKIGAEVMLIHPGPVTSTVTYLDMYNWVMEGLSELRKVAEENKVALGLENVWNKFLMSPLEASDLIDKIDSPYVGIYFDIGNILLFGYPEQWIRILGKRIKEVHLKDFKITRRGNFFTYLLHGDVDWHAVMAALKETGYDGFLSAELGPYAQFPDKALRDISTSIDALLDLVQ